MPNLVIVVSQGLPAHHSAEMPTGLAVHQRQSHQVLAIQKQQVEEEEDQSPLTGIGRILNQVEGGHAIWQHPAKFAVKVLQPW